MVNQEKVNEATKSIARALEMIKEGPSGIDEKWIVNLEVILERALNNLVECSA